VKASVVISCGDCTTGVTPAVLAREVEVALVVRRAAEDGAGAVFHQTKLAIQIGIGRAVEGVPHRKPVSKPRFSGLLDHRLAGAHGAALGDEGGGLGERCAAAAASGCSAATARKDMPNSVSGRVVKTSTSRRSVHRLGQGEADARTLGAADPVGLHQRTRSGQRSMPSSAASRSGAYW
jgi:hypothetical protein